MKQAFGLVRRLWGVFYLENKITDVQTSLKTSDQHEAQRILQAHNESECQPHFNLSLARAYLNGADPKPATRTGQEVMENIVAKKTDETRRRWEVAFKNRNFDCIRNLCVAETWAVKLLGIAEHDIQILMAVGRLTPLGDPVPNAPKWFAAVEMIRLAADQDWLHKATKDVSKYWQNKRERHMSRQPSNLWADVRCQSAE